MTPPPQSLTPSYLLLQVRQSTSDCNASRTETLVLSVSRSTPKLPKRPEAITRLTASRLEEWLEQQ